MLCLQGVFLNVNTDASLYKTLCDNYNADICALVKYLRVNEMRVITKISCTKTIY